MRQKVNDAPNPARISADATGEEGLASISFLPTDRGPRPIFSRSQLNEKLRSLAETSNESYSFELFATVAMIFKLRASCGEGK